MDDIKFKCVSCNEEVELIPCVDDNISCSCHIAPPCIKCTDTREECPNCGEVYNDTYDDDLSKYLPEQPLPQSSINAGISYSTKREGSWVVVSGTHREGMTRKDVMKKLADIHKYKNEFHEHDMFRMESFKETTFEASWVTD